MTGHPADVRRTPEQILFAQIEYIFARQFNVKQVAASSVEDAFGFPCRAAGVKNEKRRFAIHFFRRAVRIDVVQFAMPPHVPALLDMHFIIGAANQDNFLDGFCQ